MVSFSCENCGDVLTKKKLDPHRNRCRGATFTCIDCMVYFPGTDYRTHTSCMTEDQKYQGALYKPKQPKKQQNNPVEPPKQKVRTKAMDQQPYVEDIGEDREYGYWNDYQGQTEDEGSSAEPPPEAPTPPSAVDDDHVNVFDFLVATGQTPNASNMTLPREGQDVDVGDSTSLVRYEEKAEKSVHSATRMEDDELLIQYGSGPIPAAAFVTPGSKGERRKSKEGDAKKDKKRKRLHVDVPGDQVMTDAPPVLHSGLTGGLKSLMRHKFPPSPDSNADPTENSAASPLKKTRHSKHSKHSHASNGLFDMLPGISGITRTKTKKVKGTKKRSHRHERDGKDSRLIEYPGKSGEEKDSDGQLIVFKPHCDHFLSLIDPDRERGYTVNKALRRFHRQRKAEGIKEDKAEGEKELWRNLRLRVNDRGEIVLYPR